MQSDQIWKELRAHSSKRGVTAVSFGDADKGLTQAERVDVAYELPLLAHAAMEPLNFTVHATPGACEMWGGSQMQTGAVAAAAKTLGIAPEKVTFHNYMMGGGFGRRLDVDMVVKAARIAQKVDAPVKVIWTREEDITQDMYRPAYRNVMSASMTSDVRITGWTHRIAGGSVSARMAGKPPKGGMDKGSVDGALDNVYGVPNYRVEFVQADPRAVNVGYWRGVAPNNSIFAIESLMDELALKAGKDPVAFRLANLDKTPRLKAALKMAAEKSGWGNPLPARRGRGVCAQFAFGTYIATIADAEVDDEGEVRIHKFTSVLDAGHVVNPDGMLAQLQGGLVFGSTAALFGDITVKDGRVQQSNFNDYRILRMSETPAIEIHLIQTDAPPGGIGEPGCTAGPPALVNAIAAATGVRLRRLPIDRSLLARKSV
jgi:isoquinoline 1-oxidoreductase beta subunit